MARACASWRAASSSSTAAASDAALPLVLLALGRSSTGRPPSVSPFGAEAADRTPSLTRVSGYAVSGSGNVCGCHRAPPKSFLLSPRPADYLVEHGTPPDEVQRALIDETAALGAVAGMQIAPEQGAFMTLLTRLLGARRAVEVGTFTGYSALCIARGLADGGRLPCCDVSEEWTAIGRRYWERAGVADRIDLVIAPALDTLRALPGRRRVRPRVHRRRQAELSRLLRRSAAPLTTERRGHGRCLGIRIG